MYRNVCWTHRDTHGDRRQLQHEILHVCQREQQQQHAPHRSSQLSQIARCTTSLPWLHASRTRTRNPPTPACAHLRPTAARRLACQRRNVVPSPSAESTRRQLETRALRYLYSSVDEYRKYKCISVKLWKTEEDDDDDDGLLTSKVQTRIDGDERGFEQIAKRRYGHDANQSSSSSALASSTTTSILLLLRVVLGQHALRISIRLERRWIDRHWFDVVCHFAESELFRRCRWFLLHDRIDNLNWFTIQMNQLNIQIIIE